MDEEFPITITDEFDHVLYDHFVKNNPITSVFQTLEMAEVYNRNNLCQPLILVAINERTGEITATILAKILSESSGILKNLSTHSTIRGGPLFTPDIIGKESALKLLTYYNDYVKRDVLYSRSYPLIENEVFNMIFTESDYEFEGWNNYINDLTLPVDEIWSGIDKAKRKNIRRAMKKGVTVEEVTDKGMISVFYEILKLNYVSRSNPLEDITTFQAVFDVLYPKNMAKFLLAKYEDTYIAARLVLLFKDTVYDWYTGFSKEYSSFYPNDLLIWHVLEWGAMNGYKRFDFGGGGTPDQIDEGWVVFKKKFGGKLVNYGRFTCVHQKAKMMLVEKSYPLYRKLILPLRQ